jgi:hypothetical protein
MSDALDFTDMFRRDGAPSKSAPPKPRLTSSKRASEKVVDDVHSDIQENIPPSSHVKSNAESDSMVYVKNALRNMNFDIQSKDLSQAALQAIEMLYSEVSCADLDVQISMNVLQLSTILCSLALLLAEPVNRCL